MECWSSAANAIDLTALAQAIVARILWFHRAPFESTLLKWSENDIRIVADIHWGSGTVEAIVGLLDARLASFPSAVKLLSA